MHGSNTVGWMGTLDDSAIYITSSSIALKEYDQKPENFMKIDYRQINAVTIKRKGTMGRSILFGTLIGMTVGAIAGLASGDDPQTTIFAFSAEEKAVAGAGGGAVIGCAVGAIVGALAHKTFAIKGRSDKFQEMKTTVFDRLYPVKSN